MKTIKPILEKIYDNPSLRRRIVPLFLGNPGISKTAQIEQFAKSRGVNLVSFITSARNPFEISGMAMSDARRTKMTYLDFDTLKDLKDGDILFFDEFGNGNQATANSCLTLLENREMISGKKLADVMIVAAANPVGMMPLTPQIKERFMWYDIKFDKDSWQSFMMDKYKMPKSISNPLAKLIEGEKFTGQNFFTPRSIDKAVEMLIHDVLVPSEYKHIETSLNIMVNNVLKEKIPLPDGKFLEENEKISWLNLVRYALNNK